MKYDISHDYWIPDLSFITWSLYKFNYCFQGIEQLEKQICQVGMTKTLSQIVLIVFLQCAHTKFYLNFREKQKLTFNEDSIEYFS